MTFMKVRALLIATPVFLFSASYAGGDGGIFVVASFASDLEDAYVLELRPIGRESEYPLSCPIVKITGEYASLYWLFRSGPSSSQHRAALRVLEKAFKTQAPFRFGWMGEGLARGSDRLKSCTFSSRALSVEEAFHGSAVFSYYKWP
jgi:hypothetical protein